MNNNVINATAATPAATAAATATPGAPTTAITAATPDAAAAAATPDAAAAATPDAAAAAATPGATAAAATPGAAAAAATPGATAAASMRDLQRPDGLNEAGQRAHAIICAYLQQHGQTRTGGCQAFYSPLEWRAREEEYGTKAHLIIVYDGGALRPVFSMDAAYEFDCAHYRKTSTRRPPYALCEGMQDKLREAGLYFEECTRWYSAIYSIQRTT